MDPGTGKTLAEFTNVPAGSIPRSFGVEVSYSNGTSGNATLTVSCAGATVTPASVTVAPGMGSHSFTVTHTASGSGHTLSTALTQNGHRLAGQDIAVDVD